MVNCLLLTSAPVAEAIVRFRESAPAPAFREPMDLTQVRGIGEITAQKLAPYLYFPDAAAGE